MINLRRPNISYKEGDRIPPSNLCKQRVEEYAAQVAKVAEFGVGDDPGQLVDRLGGRITYHDLDEWLNEDGSVFVHAEADFEIVLPSYTSPLRDRFTVAHELGHYFLHSDQGAQPMVAYRKGSTRIEWEANWFAASLLMPRQKFRAACQQSHDNLAVVSAKFGVSIDAARVRRDSIV
jgi:hypothetical protein